MSRTVLFPVFGFGLAALGAAGLLSPDPAQAQSLCEVYTVQKGDDLSRIAKTAGLAGGYQLLYSANRDVLDNPNVIEIGVQLKIPCADGSLPVATGATAPEIKTEPQPDQTAASTETASPEPTAELPPVKFLTGGNYAPFTDEDMPNKGMFTELATRALELGAPGLEYRVVFVNDWGSHLSDLLPIGAFDLGFPWYLPDCSKLENLSPPNAIRCTEFNASDPFFEAVVGFYTLNDGQYASATGYDQIEGATLCRPDGWFTFDLEAEQLVEPRISMLVAPTQVACWEALQAGEADIVTFDALPAEADLVALGLEDQVTDLPELATVARLHVLAHKSNANGQAYLDILNMGLAEMQQNGEWFAIVSKGLASTN